MMKRRVSPGLAVVIAGRNRAVIRISWTFGAAGCARNSAISEAIISVIMSGKLLQTTAPTRIASLLPAGTEIVCALGARDRLAGVSHACDHPPGIEALPRLTLTTVTPDAASAAIDAEVRALSAAGEPVIAVDGPALSALRPDLIIAQDLCEVCAVTDGAVCALPDILSPPPPVLTLSGRTLEGIFEDIRRIGEVLDHRRESAELLDRLRQRLSALAESAPARPPRVVVIEWLEPLYLAGHWVPDLVAAAGGVDAGAAPGSHSVVTSWDRLVSLEPEVIVLALCGFGLERGVAEWASWSGGRSLPAPVFAIDGNAYTSRPGPRVVEGAELLASIFSGREASGVVRVS